MRLALHALSHSQRCHAVMGTPISCMLACIDLLCRSLSISSAGMHELGHSHSRLAVMGKLLPRLRFPTAQVKGLEAGKKELAELLMKAQENAKAEGVCTT
eukprot:1160512-Pelagomonas_calceolata.AAC.6